MALHDDILWDVQQGLLPVRFSMADLRRRPDPADPTRVLVGTDSYAKNHVNTTPRNESKHPDGSPSGDATRNGSVPRYVKFAGPPVTYQVLVDWRAQLRSENWPNDAEGAGEALVTGPETSAFNAVASEASLGSAGPVAMILNQLASASFQPRFRKRPHGAPVRGWNERLAAYFWPQPQISWAATNVRFQGLVASAADAERALRSDPSSRKAQDQLLRVFELVCLWGNVRLPESDVASLAAEVLNTLDVLDRGLEPSSRLNSAWTKLYVVLRPDSFVIFDSRVATALTSLLDRAMPAVVNQQEWRWLSDLGTVVGRGGSRPRKVDFGWRNGYRDWRAQLAANRLCLLIQDGLNQAHLASAQARTNWTLREVEAVLFMEGY
jgi:hypothetical protein